MKPQIYKKLPKHISSDIINAYDSAVNELIITRNPKYKNEKNSLGFKKAIQNIKKNTKPIFIFYPWLKKVVKTIPEKKFFELRTARNKNLISTTEQNKIRSLKIGIIGLSVGSCILENITISSGPKNIKIADPDNLEISNLNRLKATILDIGKNKCSIAEERAYFIDPFLNIETFPEGINKNNLQNFLLKPKINILIDATDNIQLKIEVRHLCKKNKIPVIMATDLSDSVVLDIERFDLDPTIPIFHGSINNFILQNLQTLNKTEWIKIANKIIGEKYINKKMQQSLFEVGKSLAGVPQLGSTANMAGVIINYVIKKIALKESVNSGKYFINLENIL